MWPIVAACGLVLIGWALWLLAKAAERRAAHLEEERTIYRASAGVLLPPPPRVPREFRTRES